MGEALLDFEDALRQREDPTTKVVEVDSDAVREIHDFLEETSISRYFYRLNDSDANRLQRTFGVARELDHKAVGAFKLSVSREDIDQLARIVTIIMMKPEGFYDHGLALGNALIHVNSAYISAGGEGSVDFTRMIDKAEEILLATGLV